jgi:hypothetical protein
VVTSSKSKAIVPDQRIVTDIVEVLVISSKLDHKDSLVKLVPLVIVPAQISQDNQGLMELLRVHS